MDSLQATGRRALSVKRFCDENDVCRSTVYNLIRAGKLSDVKVLGKRLILEAEAEALLRPKGAR